MEKPEKIESVVWNDTKKKWETEIIDVEEYHGFTECRRCGKIMSHNVKTSGQFKVVYVKCDCSL